MHFGTHCRYHGFQSLLQILEIETDNSWLLKIQDVRIRNSYRRNLECGGVIGIRSHHSTWFVVINNRNIPWTRILIMHSVAPICLCVCEHSPGSKDNYPLVWSKTQPVHEISLCVCNQLAYADKLALWSISS